jgi:two-component system sensor histidine kinase/response regulator
MSSAAPRPVRILVADDHAINRLLARKQLQALGFTVDVVETGLEAVEATRRTNYDLILMDCHMPEMDGFEATRAIREHEGTTRHTPIVALTASVAGKDRHLCLTAGMDDFALKPVTAAEMKRLLERWIFAIPALEPSKIALLRQTSAGLMGELIEIYATDTPQRVEALRDALTHGDAKALAASAHYLRSSSGNVGAMRVFDLCGKLEMIGRAGDMNGAAALVEELAVENERAIRELRELEVGHE